MKNRVIFVNLHYLPDVAATGQYVSDVAETLVSEGFQVEVWCGKPAYHTERVAEKKELINGVLVNRIGGTSFGRASLLGRLTDYLTYVTGLFFKLLFQTKSTDIIISLTTPPLVGVLASLAKIIRKFIHIHWVMDLHPEAEAAVGMLKTSSLMYRILTGIMGWSYRLADAVVTLGPVMRSRVIQTYQVNPEKTREIPVWANINLPDAQERAEARTFHWPDIPKNAFVVNYSGNLGLVHDDETMFEVMKILRNEPFWFTISGDGPRRKLLEKNIRDAGLTNVRFKGYVPRADADKLNIQGDVNWFSLRAGCGGIAVPSKAVAYCAANLPIIFIGPKDSDPWVWLSDIGENFTFNNGDAAAVASQLRMYRAHPESASAAGHAVRKLYTVLFTWNQIRPVWIKLVENFSK